MMNTQTVVEIDSVITIKSATDRFYSFQDSHTITLECPECMAQMFFSASARPDLMEVEAAIHILLCKGFKIYE